MFSQKAEFLRSGFLPAIKSIPSDTNPQWGKMGLQHMVEHVTGFFKLSNGTLQMPQVTATEHLPKFKEFLLSEKEFRENTKAPMLPDEPLPLRKKSLEEAYEWLEKEVKGFFDYFTANPSSKTLHPVFGELDFEEWVQLHHKHVKHHLKQFGKTI